MTHTADARVRDGETCEEPGNPQAGPRLARIDDESGPIAFEVNIPAPGTWFVQGWSFKDWDETPEVERPDHAFLVPRFGWVAYTLIPRPSASE